MNERLESTYKQFTGVFEGIVQDKGVNWAEINFVGCKIYPVSIEVDRLIDSGVENLTRFKTRISAFLKEDAITELELNPVHIEPIE